MRILIDIIEYLRSKMIRLAEENEQNLLHSAVIETSQKLDRFILQYQLREHIAKNSTLTRAFATGKKQVRRSLKNAHRLQISAGEQPLFVALHTEKTSLTK